MHIFVTLYMWLFYSINKQHFQNTIIHATTFDSTVFELLFFQYLFLLLIIIIIIITRSKLCGY